eukprot:Gb_41502 [translate_table: standard]
MNRLEGSIPSSLSNCQNLANVSLANNRLTGYIPPQLGQLTKAERCHSTSIGYYHSTGGYIPLEFGEKLAKLQRLNIWANQLSGNVPKSLSNCSQLTLVSLGSNRLRGNTPVELGKLPFLEHLQLWGNQLVSGSNTTLSILTALTNCSHLQEIDLGDNHLTGVLPVSIGQLSTELNFLRLAGNYIRGELPQEIANLTMLTYIDLSSNNFTGRNMLEGPLPPEVGKMEHVQAIDISKNKSSGQIPATIESCPELWYLHISWNALQGPIPNSLAQLKSLEDVDLSNNNLSGSIPKSLEKLGTLRNLNLSFNNFSGEIPRAGVFANLTVTSFMGNPGLCGQWLNMPPCSTPTRTEQRDHKLLKEIVIPIVSITCFILCISLVSRFLCTRCWQKSKKALALNVGYPRISHRELIDATNGFNEANLLGVGSFGVVYKATFSDGRMAAVKVLNLQNEEAHKSFSTECKALSRVRHRNLVRIITCCSDLEFKALVLEFMPSGSLEKKLYSDNVFALNLRERMKIAIDIAHAMEYLHHQSPVQVVHCDLKPANVLLDENMTARVADFGIARIICANSMDMYTSTIKVKGSVGYIAPENGQGGMVSTKGDVYSYGILLLEMLTRRRPTDDMFSGGLNLQKWVNMAFPERLVEVVDECLLTNVSDDEQHKIYECVREMMGVGLACTKEMPQHRPEMREVVRALESIR